MKIIKYCGREPYEPTKYIQECELCATVFEYDHTDTYYNDVIKEHNVKCPYCRRVYKSKHCTELITTPNAESITIPNSEIEDCMKNKTLPKEIQKLS